MDSEDGLEVARPLGLGPQGTLTLGTQPHAVRKSRTQEEDPIGVLANSLS